MKAKPKVLVLTGYGINCDEETQFAFEKAGAIAERVHVNDIIAGDRKLSGYQILTFPGGFSFGDDTGSGNALAARMRGHLWDQVNGFVQEDKLVLGICNGFQVLTRLGLLPGIDRKYGAQQVALVHNDNARYTDRWVDLRFSGHSPWTKNLGEMMVPIAHGEGKLYTDAGTLETLRGRNLIAARYIKGFVCKYQCLEANPNGSLEDIAGLTDESRKVFGLMPHPERAIDFTQLPDWPVLKEQYKREGKEIPKEGPGMQIFRNGVDYFK
jgi:phosphoribosylformylglycinamidine synthase I